MRLRAANAQLRAEMTERGNYFGEIEHVGRRSGPGASAIEGQGAMSKGDLNALAKPLRLQSDPDLPRFRLR